MSENLMKILPSLTETDRFCIACAFHHTEKNISRNRIQDFMLLSRAEAINQVLRFTNLHPRGQDHELSLLRKLGADYVQERDGTVTLTSTDQT